MKFEEFLKESYKEKISKDEVLDILRNNNPDNILYRGMNNSGDYCLITGEDGHRRSANTHNYYTIIIDHILKGTDYPLRSKSIICSKSWSKAEDFSRESNQSIYVIIPLKGTKVACVNDHDIWDLKFKTRGLKDDLITLNDCYKLFSISDTNYHDFIDSLTALIEDKDNKSAKFSDYRKEQYEFLKSIFNDSKNVEKDVISLYKNITNQFSLHNNAYENPNESHKFHEYWVGGKCLAIKRDIYNELIKEIS